MIKEYWEFHPEWLEYVRRVWKGLGRVEQTLEETPESLAFKQRSASAFQAHDIPFRHIKTYVNCQVPSPGEGYAPGYPHVHEPQNATTLVHYLYPGNQPAPLDIFEDGKIVETIYPEAGLTVFMPNSVYHGVRKNNGTDNRIAMIATALR